MKFINKQDNPAVACLDIFENGLEPFLKFATVFRAGYKSTHIKCKYCLVLETLGNITPYNTLCQAFHYRGFTYTGLTDKNRIVLRLTRQYPDNVPNLGIPSYNRIKLLASGTFNQILPVLFESIVCSLGIICSNVMISPDRSKGRKETLSGDPVFIHQILDIRVRVFEHGQEQMLDGNI